jgi:hypothetical protein
MTTLPITCHGSQVHFGIDPSKNKTGIAVIVDGKLVYYTTLDVWDVLPVRKFRAFIHEKGWVDVIHDVRVSCEVSGHSKFSNFDVNRAAGMALAYITSVGLTCGPLTDRVKFWYPQQWRKQFFGTASKDILGITDWKKHARDWVTGEYGLEVTDDEAEAICLARLCKDFHKEQNETKVQKTSSKRQSRMAKAA